MVLLMLLLFQRRNYPHLHDRCGAGRCKFCGSQKVYDEKYEEYQLQLKAQAAIKLAEEKLRNKNLLTADANRIYVNDTVAKAALCK